ncbi:hypothetical protein [Streptomyces griseoluteus]|uniref:hypothetical protein n=1 Tax=Streptomyces griseoluteus TaxID=29306 RepID=UPI0036FF8051
MTLPECREQAPAQTRRPRTALAPASALCFVLLIGVVSMFSDMTHEGARGLESGLLDLLDHLVAGRQPSRALLLL